MMVLGSGVRDLASCLSTGAYWKAKGVTVSVDGAMHELEAVKPADLSKLIADLDADDVKDREAATTKIAAIGVAALPGLEEAARTGSPEVAARAGVLLAKIRVAGKAASVRRLMAIRTLGEMKDAKAVPVLQPLLNSKDPFEADYARVALAKIEGREIILSSSTDAERAAEVNLLPARLDAVAQVTAWDAGNFSLDVMFEGVPLDEKQKTLARDGANKDLLGVLETVGDIRLDVVTWGFFAAPPGQPGNSILIAHGLFDSAAVSHALVKVFGEPKKVDGFPVFQMGDDAALIVASDQRVVFLSREGGGDLALEAMTAALKNGAGDLSTNADLSQLVKSTDVKSRLWGAVKLSEGVKQIVGPLASFDTATLVGTQAKDAKQKFVTNLQLNAMTSDPAKAKEAVEATRQISCQRSRNRPSATAGDAIHQAGSRFP